MDTPRSNSTLSKSSRREFLQKSALAAGAAMTATLPVSRSAHAAGAGGFKIGLIGCGGRGSGAAVNAMNAGKDIKLTAMADIFEDKAFGSRDRLKRIKPEQVAVDDDHCFVGFDAYQKVIDSGVDVVLIAAASHFHPQFLEAAVGAGKHVFCEKPHSLDVPGLKRVMDICKKAEEKKLAIVSGLCNRYNPVVRETMKRVHDGQIGDIVTIQETYAVGPYHVHKRDPKWTELEWQMRDWYHFNWLAGDQCLQQLIHSIDKGAWAMHDQPPVKAWGVGGRSACFGESYGDLFDHQAIVYEYGNGVRMFGICRNQVGCYNEMTDKIFGTKGIAHLLSGKIEGPAAWKYEGAKANMYDVEHQELFDSIREGRPINNGTYMVRSTMLALLSQFVCHTGKEITWDQAWNSTPSVELPRYAWDVEPPIQPNEQGEYDIAVPGLTRFA